MVSPQLHKRKLIIELDRENIQDLNDENYTVVPHKAWIELTEKDFTEPSMFFTIRIGITRTTLVRLLREEVEIDNITLKLKK